MSHHCPGDDCPTCSAAITRREFPEPDDGMSDRAADQYERAMEAMWP
jgi:hypothetical protein